MGAHTACLPSSDYSFIGKSSFQEMPPLTSTSSSILERAGLVSELLSQEHIDRARQALGNGHRVAHAEGESPEGYDQRFAQWLVAEGVLNRWQAEQLLRGRTKFNLGPYRIIDAIGYGGMGYVFKGEHSLLGRIEAI